MSAPVNALIELIKRYRSFSSRANIPNELSKTNPAALDFFTTRLAEHQEIYKGLNTIYLNPVISILHDCGIPIMPFLSCWYLPGYQTIGVMPLQKKQWSMIIREEYIKPGVFEWAKFLLDLIPNDIIMYLLITKQFEDFISQHYDEILSLLKQNELYHAPSERTWAFKGQE